MKVIFSICALLLLCDCAHAAPGTPAATASPNGNIVGGVPITDLTGNLAPLSPNSVLYSQTDMAAYLLGPGDTISITVTPQDRYSLPSVPITQSGDFDYPRLGDIQANGLTVTQLKAVVEQKLGQFCVNPDVTIVVTGLRPQPVYVTGGVASPRILDVRAASTVAKAITLAGGANDQNMLSRVTIFRGAQTLNADVYKILIDGEDNGQNLLLQANDLIVVPVNTAKIDVLGAVNSAGVYPLQQSGGNEGPMRMSDALSQAGGVAREGARVHEVRLIRDGPDGKPAMTKYDYGKYMQYGDMTQNPVLQDKDMIVVPDAQHVAGFGDLFQYFSVYGIFKAL